MQEGSLPVYFHGLPGGASELRLFGAEATRRAAHFSIAQRHFARLPPDSDRFAAMSEALKKRHRDRPLRLIGFSLGAAAALRVAALLGNRVESIDLVSAAAPLDLGDYLPGMAGASVFQCARRYPVGFGLLSTAQSALARLSPATLFSLLFSSAKAADAQLREDPRFRDIMQQQFSDCLTSNLDVYRAEIAAYVANWSALLPRVSQPVAIFHGQSDNWSPVEMAHDLSAKLPNCRSLNVIDGLSHYSTLREYLERV